MEGAPPLTSFFQDNEGVWPRIYVDSREASTRKGKKIVEKINQLGAETVIRRLDFGDFIIGKDVAVERKTAQDLAGTLTKRFLFDQIFFMKRTYPNAILLIEGYMGLLRKFRKITPESLYGALFTISQGGIPIVPTVDCDDTAIFLVTAARQLLKEGRSKAVIRHRPKMKNIREKQLYAVTGLPSVGYVLAENLLRRFGSVRSVFSASREELISVKGIGPLIASEIMKVLDASYNDGENKTD